MTVVAIVPAFRRRDRIAATVSALVGLTAVDEVVVVDDGSGDGTDAEARAAGATVVQLPRNRGKGGAVAAGLEARPDADVYLLADADLAESAGAVEALLAPVLAGSAAMSIAVFPSAGNKGGFGLVRRLAASGIRRASGYEPVAPLSGQRAVRGDVLRALHLAPRFGLEVGLTIDAVRAGAELVEIPLPLDHRHTGRTVAGVRHRAGQGADILRALWPRLTTSRQRIALVLAAGVVAAVLGAWSGDRWEVPSVAVDSGAERVVLVAMPHLTWDDVGTGRLPNLDRLLARGAAAAASVRTRAPMPVAADAYTSLGAASRARVTSPFTVRPAGTGAVVDGFGEIIEENDRRHLPSLPGALGDALHEGRLRTAVFGAPEAALALADSSGLVDLAVLGTGTPGIASAVAAAEFDVAVVDPGLLTAVVPPGLPVPAGLQPDLARAKRDTDRLLGQVTASARPGTAVVVLATLPPPGTEWRLAPAVAAAPGLARGTLHSPATRRKGLVTLTDVAPTILDLLDRPVPDAMSGHPLRVVPGEPDVGRMRDLDRDAAHREAIYLDLTLAYVAVQAIVYLAAVVILSRPLPRHPRRRDRLLRVAVLAVSAWPLATYLYRGIPDVATAGAAGIIAALAIDAGVVALALRARRHPLAPLAWIAGATVALLLLDVATGARLQTSSLLGYSPQSAARFTGLGNTSFAVLAATAIVAGALHVHHAPRREDALWSVGVLFALVTFADGWPTLGSDVGGTLTLVPVLSLLLLAMSGRRVTLRAAAIAVVSVVAAVGVLTAVDLARPEVSRSHLGRLATDLRDQGLEPLVDTASRKLATNFRTWRSPWAWSILVIAVYLVWFVARGRGWVRQLPPGSAVRAAAVGVLAAGLVGYAVNDSGVVVAALVFVYLGPFLTLALLEHERDVPVVLAAATGP